MRPILQNAAVGKRREDQDCSNDHDRVAHTRSNRAGALVLEAEIARCNTLIGGDILRQTRQHELAELHDIGAVGQGQRKVPKKRRPKVTRKPTRRLPM